jgi:hypothetical protein
MIVTTTVFLGRDAALPWMYSGNWVRHAFYAQHLLRYVDIPA